MTNETESYDWRKGRIVTLKPKVYSLGSLLAPHCLSVDLEATDEERQWWETKEGEVKTRRSLMKMEGGPACNHIMAPLLDSELAKLYTADARARAEVMAEKKVPLVSDYWLKNPLSSQIQLEDLAERIRFIEKWSERIDSGNLPTNEELTRSISRVYGNGNEIVVDNNVAVCETMWFDFIQHSGVGHLPYSYKLSGEEAGRAYRSFYSEMINCLKKSKI